MPFCWWARIRAGMRRSSTRAFERHGWPAASASPLSVRRLAAKMAADTGMIGPAGTHAEGGWNGFNLLHTAASRVAALDLGFVPGQGGRDVAGNVDGGQK